MTLFDGISSRLIETDRGSVTILERVGDSPETPAEDTLLLIDGVSGTPLAWQEFMQDLPSDLRVITIDLSEASDVQPQGLADLVVATLSALTLTTAHVVAGSLGCAVAVQYALSHPALSLTLSAPVWPAGFGGIRGEGSAIIDLTHKPPVLWVHGTVDAGEADAAPTRAVLEEYRTAGGSVTEVSLEGVGDAPHRERPAVVRRALLEAIGYIGHPASPAPPTETIILSSSD